MGNEADWWIVPRFFPAEWEDLIPDDLCAAEAPGCVAGEEVYCQLTEGHGGKHYNRELHWGWHGTKSEQE
jgi:hypothetical protein